MVPVNQKTRYFLKSSSTAITDDCSVRDNYLSAIKLIVAVHKSKLFKGRDFEGYVILFLCKSVITGHYKMVFSFLVDVPSILK